MSAARPYAPHWSLASHHMIGRVPLDAGLEATPLIVGSRIQGLDASLMQVACAARLPGAGVPRPQMRSEQAQSLPHMQVHPREVLVGSGTARWWACRNCECGRLHEWQAAPRIRSCNGTG